MFLEQIDQVRVIGKLPVVRVLVHGDGEEIIIGMVIIILILNPLFVDVTT
jgi:hypothetical protein